MGEHWDALDRQGRRLGFDLTRGQDIPPGVFHAIAELYTITAKREILVTRRGNKALWPFCWEITTGAVVKGETPEAGAVRELKEETGIEVEEGDLVPVYRLLHRHEIYCAYAVFVSEEHPEVKLQSEETTDYRFLPYLDFKKFLRSDQFAAPLRERFLSYESRFDQVILGTRQDKIRRD